jgi:hypothetical protein
LDLEVEDFHLSQLTPHAIVIAVLLATIPLTIIPPPLLFWVPC